MPTKQMRRGFFPSSLLAVSKPPKPLTARCNQCELFKHCKSPKMPVAGKGRREILVVGEAPGADEDKEGKPFVGKTGRELQKAFRKFGFELHRDCWVTNAAICRPQNEKGGNRAPTQKEIGYCRPNLLNAIKEYNPKLILLFGKAPVDSLIGDLWRESAGDKMGTWVGWQIPSQQLNAWVCPNWHPSFLVREENKNTGPLVRMLFERYLEQALELQSNRPWREVPDYSAQVEVIMDVREAARIIRKMIAKGGIVSLDLETDRLKPDHPKAKIVCCSVCWEGKKTIAFPWQGEAIVAMRELLRSKRLKKRGANMKFEERWFLKEFGVGVRGWEYDDMLGAHWEDNRSDITSVKFQSFVRLGYGAYDDHLKKYLKAKGGNSPNKIDTEIDLTQLLKYCGVDSFVEFLIGDVQKGVWRHKDFLPRRPKYATEA